MYYTSRRPFGHYAIITPLNMHRTAYIFGDVMRSCSCSCLLLLIRRVEVDGRHLYESRYALSSRTRLLRKLDAHHRYHQELTAVPELVQPSYTDNRDKKEPL